MSNHWGLIGFHYGGVLEYVYRMRLGDENFTVLVTNDDKCLESFCCFYDKNDLRNKLLCYVACVDECTDGCLSCMLLYNL